MKFFFATFATICSLIGIFAPTINAQTLKYMLVNGQGVVLFRDLDISGCQTHLGDKAKDGWSCVPQSR